MESYEANFNKTVGEEHWFACLKCDVETCHKVIASVDEKRRDDSWGYYCQDNYQIVQCQGCKLYSFRKSHIDTENTREDDITGADECIVHEELYPSRIAGRHKLNQEHFLPHNIAQIYSETHAALCNKQRILAGIGIRALVETVCKDRMAKGKDLEKKIDDLVTKGVLTRDGAEILHSLRILGNVAAHEVKPHSEDTLGIAMDVVEHLLQGVYLLPKAAANLPQKKSKNSP